MTGHLVPTGAPMDTRTSDTMIQRLDYYVQGEPGKKLLGDLVASARPITYDAIQRNGPRGDARLAEDSLRKVQTMMAGFTNNVVDVVTAGGEPRNVSDKLVSELEGLKSYLGSAWYDPRLGQATAAIEALQKAMSWENVERTAMG